MKLFCEAIIDGEECGAKSENRDLGLCATCNRARIKSERPQAPAKTYSMPRATAPMRPVSAKKAVALKAKAKAYAVVDEGPRVCVSCGCTQRLTHSHILPVGNFPQFEATPENILLECVECHMEYEHNKQLAYQKHASWARKVEVMERLAPMWFEGFKSKHPGIFGGA